LRRFPGRRPLPRGKVAATDAPWITGKPCWTWRGVLRAAGEPEDAAAAAREALALYERKENVVEAARASAFLAELER